MAVYSTSGLKGSIVYDGQTYYMNGVTLKRVEPGNSITIIGRVLGPKIPLGSIVEWRVSSTKNGGRGNGYVMVSSVGLPTKPYTIVIRNTGTVYSYDESKPSGGQSPLPVEAAQPAPPPPPPQPKPQPKSPKVNTYGETTRILDL
jgi:hypothetical protein